MFKLIIAGGRTYSDFNQVEASFFAYLEEHRLESKDILIVSGGASGADRLGEQLAKKHRLAVKVFPADWKQHGKAAGPIRNQEMAIFADGLLAFWDGASRGTKSMITLAKGEGLVVSVTLL